MQLDDALSQIAEIRGQIARTQIFRGYRAIPVAISAVFAVCGGIVQACGWTTRCRSLRHIWPFGWPWLWLASWSPAWNNPSCSSRSQSAHRPRDVDGNRTVLSVSGRGRTGLPIVIAEYCRKALSCCRGCGRFFSAWACSRPFGCSRGRCFSSAIWYLLSGVACLVWARGDAAFSPWAMVIPFGVGQLLTAAILYWTLERRHGPAN